MSGSAARTQEGASSDQPAQVSVARVAPSPQICSRHTKLSTGGAVRRAVVPFTCGPGGLQQAPRAAQLKRPGLRRVRGEMTLCFALFLPSVCFNRKAVSLQNPPWR